MNCTTCGTKLRTGGNEKNIRGGTYFLYCAKCEKLEEKK